MPDGRVTSHESSPWRERLGEDAGRVLAGLAICLAALVLAVWTEGRDVGRWRQRREGIASATDVPPNRVDPRRGGRFVLVSGRPSGNFTLTDPVFGVTATALKLERVVEMYQWRERREVRIEQPVGSPATTNTVVLYERTWWPALIGSSTFRDAQEHRNPTHMPFVGQVWSAESLQLGAFVLNSNLVAQIVPSEPLAIGSDAHLPAGMEGPGLRTPEEIFIGESQANPRPGDIRVRFRVAPVTELTVAGRQTGSGLTAFKTRRGVSIESLWAGRHTAKALADEEVPDNGRVVRWFLRGVATMCLFLGGGLFLVPLASFPRVRTMVGDLQEGGAVSVSLAWAVVAASAAMGLTWICWRPVLGIPLLLPAGAAILVLRYRLVHGAPKSGKATSGT